MWVPTLLGLEPDGGVPTGAIFSAMMMSITIGGMIYPYLQASFSRILATPDEACAAFVYALAGCSMAVPALSLSASSTAKSNFGSILASFMVVECCVGLFMPVAGTLRSKYVPDALQGAILNIFRLPLNAVVVLGTHATDVLEPATVFFLVSASFLMAALLQISMMDKKSNKVTKRD